MSQFGVLPARKSLVLATSYRRDFVDGGSFLGPHPWGPAPYVPTIASVFAGVKRFLEKILGDPLVSVSKVVIEGDCIMQKSKINVPCSHGLFRI